MANFNRILKPKANLGHNGFDLSTNQVFSTKVGMLNVPYVVDTVPSSTYDIDVSALVRTQTLNKPAFLRLKGFVHFYFVPYRILWHQWDNFYTQRVDQNSSYTLNHAAVPNVDIQQLVGWCIDYYDPDVGPIPGVNYSDGQGYDAPEGVIRMLDMLGYGNYTRFFYPLDKQSVFENTPDYHPNIFRALAYNKIWYDYHRNPFWNNEMAAKCYNADYLNCGNVRSADITQQSISESETISNCLRLFEPKYVRWKADLFMGCLPNQQFGGSTTLSANDVFIKNLSKSDSIPSSARTGLTTADKKLAIVNSDGASIYNTEKWSVQDLFDVLELRKAESLQLWKEKTLRAGNRAYDQYKAHFGVEPSDLKAEHSDYIGGFSFNVGVDEVTNMTQSQDAKLGDIGAKGYGVGSHHLRYKADEFGVLMGVLYFIPENVYTSSCIDPQLTMADPFDFYTPEFQNVGLQALPRYLLSNYDDDSHGHAIDNLMSTIGYTARYFQYKTAIDRVHGLFDPELQNELATYVATRRDLQSPRFQYLTDGHLYVNPNIMDKIFGVNADSHQQTDQLYCNFNFDVKAVLPMSVVGLPNYM